MMGTCLLLIVLAWNVVRLWSATAAVVMSVGAAVLPPAAVIVGNLGATKPPAAYDETRERRHP